MNTSSTSEKDILPPKQVLLGKKVNLLQSLFKQQFKRNLCYYKTNDFLVDSFEPSASDLKIFVTSINGKELKHQVSLLWEKELAQLHARHPISEDGNEFLRLPDDEDTHIEKPTINFVQSTPAMEKIVRRAVSLYSDFGVELDPLSLMMDLSAAKYSMPEIHFETLLEFKDGDFAHDISGIHKNLNRETGLLENLFLPRCARFVIEDKDVFKSSN